MLVASLQSGPLGPATLLVLHVKVPTGLWNDPCTVQSASLWRSMVSLNQRELTSSLPMR